jgi:N-acetylneuraminic acid mutarotase
MPEGSIGGVSGAIDGRLYLLNTLVNRFDRYDPSTDTWSPLPKCPGRHFRGAAAVINGKFYVAGGEWFTSAGPYAIRKLHMYDPSTNRWSEETAMPHAISGAAGARLLGQFYMMGGNNTVRGFDFVQVYDPVAKTWTLKAPLPTSRIAFAASSFLNLNGRRRLVAIGGFGGLGDRWQKSNDVYRP